MTIGTIAPSLSARDVTNWVAVSPIRMLYPVASRRTREG